MNFKQYMATSLKQSREKNNDLKSRLKEIITLYNSIKDLPDLKLQLKIIEERLETEEISSSEEGNFYLPKIKERLKEVNREIEKFDSIRLPLTKETIVHIKELRTRNFINENEFKTKLNEFLRNAITTFSIRNINGDTIDLQICLVIKKDIIEIWKNVLEFENAVIEKLEKNLKKMHNLNHIYEDEKHFYLIGDQNSNEIEICKNLKNLQKSQTFFKEKNLLNSFIANYLKENIRKEFCMDKINIDKVNEMQNLWFKGTEFYVNNLNEWAVTSYVRKFLNEHKCRGILIRKTINIKIGKEEIKQISSEIYNLTKIFDKMKTFKTERNDKILETKKKCIKKQFYNLGEINSEKLIIYLSDLEYLYLQEEIKKNILFEYQNYLKESYKLYLKETGIFIENEKTTIENIKEEYNDLTKLINEISTQSIGLDLYFNALIELILEISVDFDLKYYIFITDFAIKFFNKFYTLSLFKHLKEINELLKTHPKILEIQLQSDHYKYLRKEDITKFTKKFFNF